MRTLKNKKSDLESKKVIFFQIGLVITLLSVLYAFEYKSYEKYEIPEFNDKITEFDYEIINPTIHKKKLPPPPKPILVIKPELIDEGNIEDFFFDAAADGDTPIEDWEPEFEPEPQIIEVDFFTIPGVMPSFPGGTRAMMKFLSSNLIYPQLAKDVGITGIVYLEFIVEKDGSITNILVLKNIGGGCDEEAVLVVGMMPRWNPGKQNGFPVRVKLALPVKFSLYR